MMNRAVFNRRLRQLHLWLGVAIGAQVGLWLISGLFMTWLPIEQVRGEHLSAAAASRQLEWSADYLGPADVLERQSGNPYADVEAMTARWLLDIPVWEITTSGGTRLIDARSGEPITPLAEVVATQLATARYAGQGTLEEMILHDVPPREYGRPGPVWEAQFGAPDAASLYVDASTGEVRAVRTALWRTFDFMWGLHIMDWSSRENFNSWWIKMTASLAVLFFLAGLGLVILRLIGMAGRAGRDQN